MREAHADSGDSVLPTSVSHDGEGMQRDPHGVSVFKVAESDYEELADDQLGLPEKTCKMPGGAGCCGD